MIIKNELDARQELALLYAAIAFYKWDDLIFTHASVRVPDSNCFLINKFGLMFQEVTADNLIMIDIDNVNSNNVDPELVNLAGYNIHSAIYQHRPRINCVIHTHTKEGVAVSASTTGLLPISQYSCGVLQNLSYHDYCGAVVDESEGENLCRDLGNNNNLILKNHGLITIGIDIPMAFLSMYNLQKACEIQVLTNVSQCSLVSNQVLSTTISNLEKFSKHNSPRDLAWAAVRRLVKND